MSMTNVNFRLDSDVKRDMEIACKAMGMNLTTAFTIFAKKVANEQRIPFEISADPFYSESNTKFLREAIDALNRGEGKIHDLKELGLDE